MTKYCMHERYLKCDESKEVSCLKDGVNHCYPRNYIGKYNDIIKCGLNGVSFISHYNFFFLLLF